MNLTPDAIDGLQAMADRYEISLTALVEALGQQMYELRNARSDRTIRRYFPSMPEVVVLARTIDRDRRRRRSSSPPA